MKDNYTALLNLIREIQDKGVTYKLPGEPYTSVGNETLADFLVLNEVTVPPVRVGDRIKTTSGREYIIVDYRYRKYRANDSSIRTEEVIEVMDSIYDGKNMRRTHQYTPDDFFEHFPEYKPFG